MISCLECEIGRNSKSGNRENLTLKMIENKKRKHFEIFKPIENINVSLSIKSYRFLVSKNWYYWKIMSKMWKTKFLKEFRKWRNGAKHCTSGWDILEKVQFRKLKDISVRSHDLELGILTEINLFILIFEAVNSSYNLHTNNYLLFGG